jgi:hypothetical protein
MNKRDMEELLSNLGNKLLELDKRVIVGVYGGAVMCMEYELRQSSFDIDVIYNEDVVRKLALEIADENGISKSWFNDSVKMTVYEDMIPGMDGTNSTTRTLGGLVLQFPSPEQMLAMKLFAARTVKGSSDLVDSVELCKMIGIVTREEMLGVLRKYFKKESIRERNMLNGNIIGRFVSLVESSMKG